MTGIRSNNDATMIEAIFTTFGIAAMLLFRFVAPPRAVAVTCFAGWLLLPIGNFPAGSAETVFPLLDHGCGGAVRHAAHQNVVPSHTRVGGRAMEGLGNRDALAARMDRHSGAVVVPVADWAMVLRCESRTKTVDRVALSQRRMGRALAPRPHLFFGRRRRQAADYGYCDGVGRDRADSIGRERFWPRLYGWFYELHPFRFDGQQRYVGFRPLGLFEHGNQYGIWVAITSLAAIWLWQAAPNSRSRGRLAAIAVLGLAIALMSQSVGAILLLCAGLVLLSTIGRPLTRWVLPLILLLMASGGAIYLSGVVPLRAIAENTVIGRHMVDIIRSSGRSSFTWRIAQYQRALTLIHAHPIFGTARWD